MKKHMMAGVAGILAGTLITTQFAGPLIAQEAEKTTNVYEQLDLFGDVFERIRAQYVEPVDEEALIESAIDGMLSSLDPHSSYLSPKDAAAMQVQTSGSFGGLGIEVTQEEGFVKVVAPMDGTPADIAGVEAGDFIT
ncbi:S41 family peptidase, partial [Celeribacter marinus]